MHDIQGMPCNAPIFATPGKPTGSSKDELAGEVKEVKWLCERIMRTVAHVHAALYKEEEIPEAAYPVGPTREEYSASIADVDALTNRFDALESRVDRVQESSVFGINTTTNHLSKRIDDLVDLATVNSRGIDKLRDDVASLSERTDERLNLANTRIEALEEVVKALDGHFRRITEKL